MQLLMSVSFWLGLKSGQTRIRSNTTVMVVNISMRLIVTGGKICLTSFAMIRHTTSGIRRGDLEQTLTFLFISPRVYELIEFL